MAGVRRHPADDYREQGSGLRTGYPQDSDPGGPGWGRVARWLVLLLVVWMVSAPGGVRADEELDYGLEALRLHEIRFTGNAHFSDEELKRRLHFEEPSWRNFLNVPTYKPHLVATQLRVLRNFYRNRGFHQVAVSLDSVRRLSARLMTSAKRRRGSLVGSSSNSLSVCWNMLCQRASSLLSSTSMKFR